MHSFTDPSSKLPSPEPPAPAKDPRIPPRGPVKDPAIVPTDRQPVDPDPKHHPVVREPPTKVPEASDPKRPVVAELEVGS